MFGANKLTETTSFYFKAVAERSVFVGFFKTPGPVGFLKFEKINQK